VLHYVINFAPTGLNTSQNAVGQLVNRIQTGRTDPGFAPTAAAIFSVPDTASLGRLYDLIGGQGITATQETTFATLDNFEQAVEAQTGLSSRYGGPATNLATDSRIWVQLIAGAETLHGHAADGTAKMSDVTMGAAAGWDYRPTKDVLLGVSVGGQPSRFKVGSLATSGKVIATDLATYGAAAQGDWSERWELVYGHYRAHYSRGMAVPGVSELGSGKFDSDTYTAHVEVARSYAVSKESTLTPFVAIDLTKLRSDAFSETARTSGGAAGVLGLAVKGRDVSHDRSFLGGEWAVAHRLEDGSNLHGTFRLAWAHDFNPERSIVAGFESAPDYGYLQKGAAGARDAAKLDANAILVTKGGYDLQLRSSALLSGRDQSVDAEFGLRMKW
jgi:uncharacterized protein with beta-barrel porin domain